MKKILKRLTGLATAAAVFVYMPAAAFADRYNIAAGDGVHVEATVDANGKTIYKVNGAVDNDTLIEIFGNSESQNSSYNNVLIESAAGANALIAFNGLEIRNTYDNAYAVLITGAGNVTIELDGESSLKAGKNRAGIQKESTGSLTIKDDDKNGRLLVEGGSCGAGIGGGDQMRGTNIIIRGGTVTATGGYYGAGIGGGNEGDGSDIIIKGGTVTATGDGYGAGIGGGYHGDGSDITIEGGTVTATGGNFGAGIGGGNAGDGSDITIEGGTVTATASHCGAGIGGGNAGDGSDIVIKGGTVTATGGYLGAGIGGGDEGDGSDIIVEGGTVTAKGGYGGAGIGGGDNGDGSDITVEGGTVIAQGGIGGGAGIGSGEYSSVASVTVTGSAVILAAGGVCDPEHAGAAIGTGVTVNVPLIYEGTEQDIDLNELYTTGSVTRFPGGSTVDQMKEHPELGVKETGTKPVPAQVIEEQEPTKEEPSTKEPTEPSPKKKPAPPIYTERSYMADINVAERIAAALRANPETKEITLDYADNICLSATMMKDLFADNRVAKNCLFTYKGKRYNMHVGAVNTSSDTYADCFNTLSKEPDGLAGFMKMAEIFKPVGVTLKEITE